MNYKVKSGFVAVLFACLVAFSAANSVKKEASTKTLVDSLIVQKDSLVAEVNTVKEDLHTKDTTVVLVVIQPDINTKSPLSQRDLNRITRQVVESIESDSMFIDSIVRKGHLVVRWKE